MTIPRALGAGCLLLALYWLRFFLWRHDPLTLAQLLVLVGAGTLLLLHEPPALARAVWFRGARPVAWPGWLTLAAAVAVAGLVFRVMDADAHSVSDTLHRIVPTYSLLAAVLAKIVAGHVAGITDA